MDEQTLTTIIDKQWDILPPEIQKALADGEPGATITSVSESLGLTAEQTEKLASELYIVMLGVEPVSKFEEGIKAAFPDAELADAIYSVLDIGFLTIFKDPLAVLEMKLAALDAEETPPSNPNSLATKIPITKNDGQKAIYNSVVAPEQKAVAQTPAKKPPIATMPDMPSLQEAVTGAVQAVENEVVVQKPQAVNIANRPQTPTGTMIDEKLRSIVKTPREEVTVNVAASSYGQNKDPYREPLE